MRTGSKRHGPIEIVWGVAFVGMPALLQKISLHMLHAIAEADCIVVTPGKFGRQMDSW